MTLLSETAATLLVITTGNFHYLLLFSSTEPYIFSGDVRQSISFVLQVTIQLYAPSGSMLCVQLLKVEHEWLDSL